jgi:hypothetical protein
MNATVYQFPKFKTIDADTLEKYSELIEKLGEVSFKREQLIEASNISKLFAGCHNTYGVIPEQQYKKLLAFYNSPSQENWNEIKDIRILGRIKSFEIVLNLDINYLEEEFRSSNYPNSKDFHTSFTTLKNDILARSEELISDYKISMNLIEITYPTIKNVFSI